MPGSHAGHGGYRLHGAQGLGVGCGSCQAAAAMLAMVGTDYRLAEP